jgi:hypothetical protein
MTKPTGTNGIVSCRNKVSHFGELVYNYHDGSVALGSFRKFGEKVNGDVFPTLLGNGKR